MGGQAADAGRSVMSASGKPRSTTLHPHQLSGAAGMSRSYLHGACVVALSGALQAQLQFTDVTAPAGVTSSTTFSNNFTGGGGCGDFDRDGDQDLFFVMGRPAADRLFLNDGTGVFTDVASAWGVAATHMGTAMAVGDYDDDGWLD